MSTYETAYTDMDISFTFNFFHPYKSKILERMEDYHTDLHSLEISTGKFNLNFHEKI